MSACHLCLNIKGRQTLVFVYDPREIIIINSVEFISVMILCRNIWRSGDRLRGALKYLITILLPSVYLFISARVEGSNVILDPVRVCKRSKQQQQQPPPPHHPHAALTIGNNNNNNHDNLHDICRNNTRLLDVIMKGINLSLDECQFQFRHSRWNCTSQRKSMKKVLAKGELTTYNKTGTYAVNT